MRLKAPDRRSGSGSTATVIFALECSPIPAAQTGGQRALGALDVEVRAAVVGVRDDGEEGVDVERAEARLDEGVELEVGLGLGTPIYEPPHAHMSMKL